MKILVRWHLALAATCAAIGLTALAEDAYYRLPLTALKFIDGTLPIADEGSGPNWNWRLSGAVEPYVVVEGTADAWVGRADADRNPGEISRRGYETAFIAIRATQGQALTGRLFVPNPDSTGLVSLQFKVDPSQAKADSREAFLQAREAHFRDLRERRIPGTAWFRHQERKTTNALGSATQERPEFSDFGRRRRSGDLDETFELFSGGRAISENLQLDRQLAVGSSTNGSVELSSLTGIATKAMDWKPLIRGLKPVVDPLAAFIPFDQHAVFFPSFSALIELLDEADANGTPVWQFLEPRSEDANSRGRYQKQLCLEFNELSRLLGPRVIVSAAFTGSDPFLRSGSDVAVLFETKSAGLLQTFLQARYTAAQQTNPEVKAVRGQIEGVSYSGVVSPDRRISSYMASLEAVVLVSNSLRQLENLVKAAKGLTPSLISQDEYTFFRSRYSQGTPDESAFLILTDATIRRWCGPQWRIGNSRRLRQASALAELQASHLEEIAKGTIKPGPLAIDSAWGNLGEVQLTRHGVLSSLAGSLEFMTPIAELPITTVTSAEAEAYNRWRDSYQQNWNQFFDPIAVRFSITAHQIKAEVTVMPLITGTEYRSFINFTSGGKIRPDSGDPHPESLMHLALAINPQSELLASAGNFLGGMSPSLKVNPLGWLGQSLALFADQDPFWDKLNQATNGSQFLERNFDQLPVALNFEVKNPLGLAVFLTGLRSMVEQTAPKLTLWQSFEFEGQPYVQIKPAMDVGFSAPKAIYYAATPKSLVVTFSEAVLKRTLSRQAGRETNQAAGPIVTNGAKLKPWLGTNVCLQLDQNFLTALDGLSRDQYQTAQQLLSWSNLPILNEWKRLYPDRDPVQFHEAYWQTKLLCPGGGTYVWNERWQTMESTTYGHPGEPKKGPGKFLPLARVSAVNLGLSFESQGVSAQAVLYREK